MSPWSVPGGADRLKVIALVSGQSSRQVAIGLVLGLPLAVGAACLMAARLHGVSFWDPWSLSVAAGSVAACALLAAMVPASRAAGLSPMRALRARSGP